MIISIEYLVNRLLIDIRSVRLWQIGRTRRSRQWLKTQIVSDVSIISCFLQSGALADSCAQKYLSLSTSLKSSCLIYLVVVGVVVHVVRVDRKRLGATATTNLATVARMLLLCWRVRLLLMLLLLLLLMLLVLGMVLSLLLLVLMFSTFLMFVFARVRPCADDRRLLRVLAQQRRVVGERRLLHFVRRGLYKRRRPVCRVRDWLCNVFLCLFYALWVDHLRQIGIAARLAVCLVVLVLVQSVNHFRHKFLWLIIVTLKLF